MALITFFKKLFTPAPPDKGDYQSTLEITKCQTVQAHGGYHAKVMLDLKADSAPTRLSFYGDTYEFDEVDEASIVGFKDFWYLCVNPKYPNKRLFKLTLSEK